MDGIYKSWDEARFACSYLNALWYMSQGIRMYSKEERDVMRRFKVVRASDSG